MEGARERSCWTQSSLCCHRASLPAAGAKQAGEILGKGALEVAALYDQLCIIRFLHERMEEAAEAGRWQRACGVVGSGRWERRGAAAAGCGLRAAAAGCALRAGHRLQGPLNMPRGPAAEPAVAPTPPPAPAVGLLLLRRRALHAANSLRPGRLLPARRSQARARDLEGARRGLWPRHRHRLHTLRLHPAGQRKPAGGSGGWVGRRWARQCFCMWVCACS